MFLYFVVLRGRSLSLSRQVCLNYENVLMKSILEALSFIELAL